jgi:hypothetical protein
LKKKISLTYDNSMFFQLLYIHLFRPFLKYSQANSPLPAHVSPRKMCSHAAETISKLLRLYKRTYGLRQICNIAVYIAHSACTIHLLNLPEKNAKRDIIHGIKQLEEIAESWLCARRTLGILSLQVRKWKAELPEEAAEVLARTDAKYGHFRSHDSTSPTSETASPATLMQTSPSPMPRPETNHMIPTTGLTNGAAIPNLSQFRVHPSNGIYSNNIPTQTSPLQASPSYTNTPSPNYTSAPLPKSYMPPPAQSQSQPQKTQWASPRSTNDANMAQNHASPSSLFNHGEILEESKDWWLKDQSAIFDHWPKHEAVPLSMMNGMSSGMNGLSPNHGYNGLVGGIDDGNGVLPVDGWGTMGYDEGYGFGGGDIYH